MTPKEKERQIFKIGDFVSWESQSKGWSTVKCGTIVQVIQANHHPLIESLSTHTIKFDGMFRNHESYLVEVPHPGSGKPSLYHPRVSQLKKEKI